MVSTFSRIRLNRVWLPKREIHVLLSPFAPENWSRETISAVPSRVSPLVLHTHAEFGPCSWAPVFPPRRRSSILSTAIELFPTLSCHVIAYRWRLLTRVCRHRAVSPQGSSSNGCCLFTKPRGSILRAPLFPHPLLVLQWTWVIQTDCVGG